MCAPSQIPQFAAIALIFAAALGLVLANSALSPQILAARDFHLGPLSLGHWVTDGLLAVFFLLAAIELKHELRHGELASARAAAVPVVAALGGVLVPALVFLLLVPSLDMKAGWPIPTATDIAFALGILAIAGRALPTRVRALLLAIAVIDDLVAILIIAVVFSTDLEPLWLLAALGVLALFAVLARRGSHWWLLLVLGLLVWVLVARSGVHPTIAGVALGLALPSASGERLRARLEPWSNAVVLPLFAFTATLVVIPDLAVTPLGAVFWAVAVALPLGKLLGITGGAAIAQAALHRGRQPIPVGDLLTVAALGGIGFTVSLLMNELAFAGTDHRVEGTLGVLAGSLAAMVIGGTLAALRSRWYTRRPPL